MSSMDKTQFSILEVKTQILENEARAAALLRERLRKEGILFVNLMASPGAGKTTTLVRTIEALGSRYRIGVITGGRQDHRRHRHQGPAGPYRRQLPYGPVHDRESPGRAGHG